MAFTFTNDYLSLLSHVIVLSEILLCPEEVGQPRDQILRGRALHDSKPNQNSGGYYDCEAIYCLMFFFFGTFVCVVLVRILVKTAEYDQNYLIASLTSNIFP